MATSPASFVGGYYAYMASSSAPSYVDYWGKGRGVLGLEPIQHYEFEGLTVNIYSIESAQTLKQFIEGEGLRVPEELKSFIERYLRFYISVIKAEVQPIISEEKIDFL